MSWIRGTATDYSDLSDELVNAATGNSVATVAVNSGGTGYTVGDILSIAGGTGTVTAQVEVTSVAAGVIDGVRIYNAGVYTATPSTPNSATGGTGSGASITLTFTGGNGWTANRNTGRGISAVDSIASGGTGYSVNDVITLAGGVYDTVATLTVTTVSSGAVTGVSITEAGDYEVYPADPVAQASVAPTGGSGATFNLTWEAGERIVMLEGEGGGADAIHAGWRTFQNSTSGYYNWELHAMTGFNSANKFADQPGVSPGFYDATLSADKAGAYLLLSNTSIEYWFSITSYRIIGIVKVGTAYFNFYMGWGNRFATSSEYPYPMIVAGHTSLWDAIYNQSQLSSGLTDPWTDSDSEGSANGPMLVYYTDGAWWTISNGLSSVSSRTARRDRVVCPAGIPNGVTDNSVAPENKFVSNIFDWGEIINYTSASGATEANVSPTPGTADFHILFPCPIVFFDPTHQIVMELDDVYWVSGFGSITTEDRIIESGEVYRVFQNCNRTDNYAYLAVKEV
jgi:hypothetical protein